MKITRRNAITSLGILASGAAIPHSASGDAAQTCIKPSGSIPRECTPDADSWVLKYHQPDPKDAAGARAFVYENFILGLQWGFAPFFPGPPKPKPGLPQPAPNCVAPKIHDRTNAVALARAQSEFKATFDKSLDKSYGKVFDDLVPSFLTGTVPKWAKDWVTLNDHAFILGCLVLALAKDRTLKNLTHRDYLRAQAKLMHAIWSADGCRPETTRASAQGDGRGALARFTVARCQLSLGVPIGRPPTSPPRHLLSACFIP